MHSSVCIAKSLPRISSKQKALLRRNESVLRREAICGDEGNHVLGQLVVVKDHGEELAGEDGDQLRGNLRQVVRTVQADILPLEQKATT